jgi:hypothetical protein
MLFHFDQPVRVDESLQMQAEHIGQPIDELLMTRPRLSTIVRVILNRFHFEIRVKALLNRVGMTGHLEVKHVEGLVSCVHLLTAFHMELGSEHTAKDVSDNRRLHDFILI